MGVFFCDFEAVRTPRRSKLEELVAGSSKDMNAAEASMRLVAMMSGDVVEQTASRLRKSFGDLVDEELLRVLRTEPEARTEYDVDVVERHVSWHSIFKDLKPLMRRKMCRALKCAEYEYGDIIVVQGDAAESFCIVYQGEVSVHCWRERSEVKLMLKERPSGSIARNKSELMEEAPYVIGGRVGVLRQGNSFGENGMDPSGTAKRSATCVSASSREDVQTDVFDGKEEEDSEDDEPALDCNFEPVDVAPLRRLSLKKSVGPVLPPAKEATEPTPPTTGRRTSLLSMFTPCPREATIHVTLQRRKRRGTVSPVKKLARAKALDKALND